MRMFPFLWHSLWRNRRRSVLTILGVAVAIFVFAALGAAISGITFPVREVGAERTLNVREAARSNVLASRIPVSYEERVGAIPGVDACTGILSDLAVVGSERVHIFVRGIDPEQYRKVHRIRVSQSEWTAFSEKQHAALIGHRLLARMGWEVGNEVEIAEIGLRVVIVGLIPPQGVDLENHMLVKRKYLQVVRDAEGQVSYILVSPGQDRDPVELAAAIDRSLSLSPIPTETVSAAAYAEAVISDFMGFVKYLKLMGVVTVLVTMLGAANAISISVRERTRETGMLRAIGFPPWLVLSLTLVESIMLASFGGAIGIVAAIFIVGSGGANLSGLMLPGATIVLAAICSILIGFFGGFLPALSAAKLKTIDAIRFME